MATEHQMVISEPKNKDFQNGQFLFRPAPMGGEFAGLVAIEQQLAISPLDNNISQKGQFDFRSAPTDRELETQQMYNTQLQMMGHSCLPYTDNKTKNCVYCHMKDSKTKSGWPVKCRTMCTKCNVPLCSKRGCFVNYHFVNKTIQQ